MEPAGLFPCGTTRARLHSTSKMSRFDLRRVVAAEYYGNNLNLMQISRRSARLAPETEKSQLDRVARTSGDLFVR